MNKCKCQVDNLATMYVTVFLRFTDMETVDSVLTSRMLVDKYFMNIVVSSSKYSLMSFSDHVRKKTQGAVLM